MFISSGFSLIPYIGIQTDEAIFSNVLFDGATPWFVLSVFKKKIPLMVMSYLGTAKSALWGAVFAFTPPTVYSLRVPALFLGAASILLFYAFLLRTTCPRTALFAAALLATDSSYVMATAMDWGPVAIQHVTLAAGLWLLVKAWQTGSDRALAAGMWFWGAGLWDKALLVWMLSGISVAALILFYRELTRFLTARKIILAAVFFLLGALPLVIYNVRRPLETFRGNTVFSSEDLRSKLNLLPVTLNGSVFFGFLVEEDWPVKPREPQIALERASVRLARMVGERRRSLYWAAFVLSLGLAPVLLFTRWRRTLLFWLLALGIAWAQMLATKGAGGGAHHSILLWPYILIPIAVAFVWMASRLGRWGGPFLVASGLVLCGSALLVTNHYLAQALRNGAPGPWTNAIFNLAARLPAYPAQRIYLIDWGMLDNLRLLQAGRLPLMWGSGPVEKSEPTAEDRSVAASMFAEKDSLFVTNTDDKQVYPERNQRLRKLAVELGFERELLETVYDFNGRPCYEIFRFRRAAASP